MTRIRAIGIVALLSAALVASAAPGHQVRADAPLEAPALSRYAPIVPTRVVDSRFGQGSGSLEVDTESSFAPLTAEVLAAAGVDGATVTAVVVNVTVVAAARPGFVTLWPSERSRPVVSSLNIDRAGQTLGNTATVPVGTDGRIAVFNITGGDIVVDVQGVYVRASSATAGRFEPRTPVRAYDSRQIGRSFAPGEARQLSLVAAGVPPSATAAVLNVTATETLAPGFITLHPAGSARPLASNLNVDAVGQTASNLVIAALSNGAVSVFSSGGGHVVVDLAGYYTGPEGHASTRGLFVPVSPARLFDSRTGGQPPLPPGAITSVQPADTVPEAGGAAAYAMNVTITEPLVPGYVTLYPSTATSRPVTSSINADRAGQTVANHAIVSTGSGSGFDIFTFQATHVVVDISGYFTRAAKPLPAPNTALDYGFLFGETFDGYPLSRWNPCEPIGYRIDARLATAAQRAALEVAIQQIIAGTGLTLQYLGDYDRSTTLRPPDTDLTIAFVDATDPALGGAAGIGGGTSKGPWTITGNALLSIAVKNDATVRALAMHELGHAIGLSHAQMRTEVMYPVIAGQLGWGTGDTEGLRLLGATQGCDAFILQGSGELGEVMME